MDAEYLKTWDFKDWVNYFVRAYKIEDKTCGEARAEFESKLLQFSRWCKENETPKTCWWDREGNEVWEETLERRINE